MPVAVYKIILRHIESLIDGIIMHYVMFMFVLKCVCLIILIFWVSF